jgi:outer membrane protein assembly factor BamB
MRLKELNIGHGYRRVRIVLAICGVILCSLPQLSAQEWPRWRGARLDGVSTETGLLNPWPKDGPRQIWEAPLGGGFSTVSVSGGRVVTQTKDGDHEVVVALDAVTGKELWRHRYHADYGAYATFSGGPRPTSRTGPRATPTIDGDRVYAMGATGTLVALDVTTGRQIWQRQMLKPASSEPPANRSAFPPAEVPMHGVTSSPLVVGDRLYVAPGGQSGKTLAALNKADGAVIWEALDDPVGHASPIVADIGGSPQLVFLTGIAAVGLAPQDGRLLWRYPWRTQFELNIATPIVADGQVFISSNYGKGGALLRPTDQTEPAKVWESLSMQNHFSTSVLYDGFLYGFSTTRLRCVDFRTGETRWDRIGFGIGSVIVADGNLIVLGEYGQLALAKATPEGYTEISRTQLFDDETLTWTVPVVSGGRLFVRHQFALIALDISTSGGD